MTQVSGCSRTVYYACINKRYLILPNPDCWNVFKDLDMLHNTIHDSHSERVKKGNYG